METKTRTGRVSEEHDKSVDTDTPSTRGWKTVLETAYDIVISQTHINKTDRNYVRVHKGLVDTLGFVVALLLLPELFPKDKRLVKCKA